MQMVWPSRTNMLGKNRITNGIAESNMSFAELLIMILLFFQGSAFSILVIPDKDHNEINKRPYTTTA